MRIGITDCLKEDKFDLYVHWIRSIDAEIEIVKVSYNQNNAYIFSELDGLLLTGGGDVHPRFYEMGKYLEKAKDVDAQRDEFEFDVIDKALDADIPVFGICRGMQVMNVYLGGGLVLDLESEGFDKHTSPKHSGMLHAITIHPHSLLKEVARKPEATVNSYHHQAVKNLGRGLVATAVSPDGVIEAAEWAMKEGMPFLMLVQWHPERRTTNKDMLSRNLATMFLREVQHSKRLKATTY